MANELSISYTGPNSVYAIIRRVSDGTVYNVGSQSFVSYVEGNRDNYDIPLSPLGGNLYAEDFPSAVAISIEYRVLFYEKAGGTPASTDLLLISEEGIWTGTAISPFSMGSGGGAGGTYCSVDDVKAILPHEMVDRLSDPIPDIDAELTEPNILEYIFRADMIINGHLEQYYQVPLRRIKLVHAGIVSATDATVYGYPHPIPFISQRLAAGFIYNERYTGDAGHTDGSVYGERYEKQAMKEIENIQEGISILPGQIYKGYRYIRPESLNTGRFPAIDKKM